MIVINFWCKTTTLKVVLSNEHTEFRWVHPKDAVDLIEDPSLKKSMKRLIEEKKMIRSN